MSYSSARIGAVVLGVSVLALPAGPAQAGQLNDYTPPNGQRQISYRALPGEVNNVTVTRTSETDITITDVVPITPFQALPPVGCTINGTTATCSNAASVSIALGDGDDTVTATSTVQLGINQLGPPFDFKQESLVIEGGNGNDTLTVSAPASDEPKARFDTADQVVGLYGESLVGARPQLLAAGLVPDDLPGNDTLVGGDENDVMAGGPGDDNVSGGGGRDDIDSAGGSLASGIASDGNTGSDTLSGGAGVDHIWGAESQNAPPVADAADAISCGTGGENSEVGVFSSDAVNLGAGDAVDADCEVVSTQVTCPETEASCPGSTEVTAAVDGGPASKAPGGKSQSHQLVLGQAKYKVARGKTDTVILTLKRKLVKRALGKRKSVSARQATKTKHVGKQQSKFTLKK